MYVSVSRGSFDKYFKHKRNATLGIPKGTKNAVSISSVPEVKIWIKNKNVTFEEHRTENGLK